MLICNGLLKEFENAHVFVETEDNYSEMQKRIQNEFEYEDIFLNFVENQNKIEISVTAEKSKVKRLVVRWRNQLSKETKIMTSSIERSYGDLGFENVRAERMLPWYFISTDMKKTECLGVKTGPSAICFFYVSEKDITLVMDIRSGSRSVILNSRVLHVCNLVTYSSLGDVFDTTKTFTKMMCDNPKTMSYPVYGGNNWYFAYGNSSFEEIIEDSKLMSSLSKSNENRPFMVVDDGWQICHNESYNGGPWNCANYRFKDMSKVTEQMKKEGVRPGIWFRPLLNQAKVPDNCILKVSGADRILDPSVEESLELIKNDVRVLKEFGFEMIKHDFSTWDIFGKWGFQMNSNLNEQDILFKDQTKTTAEIILNFYKAIREACEDTPIIGCNTVSHLAAGIFEMQRTGDDTSGKNFERTRIMGVNTLAFNLPQHKAFYDIDVDCVPITNEIDRSSTKNWLKLVSESGTPLFVSFDRSCADSDYKKSVEAAFDIASKGIDPARPIDWIDNCCPSKWLLNNKKVDLDWYSYNRNPFISV